MYLTDHRDCFAYLNRIELVLVSHGKLVLFFHGANEGRKLDVIQRNSAACFEMDCSHRLVEADEAANYTIEYESVIGFGRISFCNEKPEKIKVLTQLMKKTQKTESLPFQTMW
jgi:nitroimidazol reductase NimA-like FMN-containing flavoprotein (pyridoxamine 5'-phosphate oxidase superfamily)